MKTKTFLVIVLLWTLAGFGQQQVNPKVGDTIVLKSWCKVTAKEKLNTNLVNKLSDTYVDWLEPGVKFRVNSITPLDVQLVALNYNKLSEETLKKYQSQY